MFNELPVESKLNQQEIPQTRILREGVRPIMACVGSKKDFGTQNDEIEAKFDSPDVKHIDYSDEVENHIKNGFRHGGFETYVMSKIDSQNKISSEFYDCTGIVAVGVDKESGENISFMSHQDPKEFLYGYKEKFLKDLIAHLRELINRSEAQTLDITIFGGNFLTPGRYLNIQNESYIKNYLESISTMSNIIRFEVGFEPVIISGPKIIAGYDTAYFDNKERRLYLVRPKIDRASSPTTPKGIKKLGEFWDEKRRKDLDSKK